MHEWDPDIDEINKLSNFDRSQKNLEIDSNRKRYLFYHPILLDNGSIITHSSSPLIKVDRCSNLVWQIDKRFHHSLNLDFEKIYGHQFLKYLESIKIFIIYTMMME